MNLWTVSSLALFYIVAAKASCAREETIDSLGSEVASQIEDYGQGNVRDAVIYAEIEKLDADLFRLSDSHIALIKGIISSNLSCGTKGQALIYVGNRYEEVGIEKDDTRGYVGALAAYSAVLNIVNGSLEIEERQTVPGVARLNYFGDKNDSRYLQLKQEQMKQRAKRQAIIEQNKLLRLRDISRERLRYICNSIQESGHNEWRKLIQTQLSSYPNELEIIDNYLGVEKN